MLTFLLIFVIVFFIIIPLGKIAMQIYRTRKQFRDLYNSFRGNSGSQGRSDRSGTAYRTPEQKKKKIDPSVGEYVAFEEISETVTYSETTKTDFRPEPQISDAEWEEIPEK